MSRMKLGLVLETLGLPIRSALQEASRLAVSGVQVDAIGDIAPDALTATGRREFKTLLRSYNLELTALNCPLRRGLDQAEQLQPRLEHLRKVMQLAFDLECRKIIVPLPKIMTDAMSPRALTMRESLSALAGFGDRMGTRVAVEPGLDDGPTVRDYLGSYDSGSLAINFDPANFLVNGYDPITTLANLGSLIIHTDARDARTATVSGGAREVPVGAGDIDWMIYFATMESVEYRGFIVVDREGGDRRGADVASGVQFLRRFIVAGP